MRTGIIFILFFLVCFQIFGQATFFYKTGNNPASYYIEIKNDTAKVYKMGVFHTKAGVDPRIISVDTLYKKAEKEFKGRSYIFDTNKKNNASVLISNDKKMKAEPVTDIRLAYTELNHAYFFRSYFDMCSSLNNKFPLNHYSFMNTYKAWNNLPQKNYDHEQFKITTDTEIRKVHDSIFEKQTKFTNTTNYIIKNARDLNYSMLKDSLKTLPIEPRSISWYFGESAYQLCKANPENYYNILEDLPGTRTTLYYAIDQDKQLVEQIKHVEGNDKLKKEFIKEYRSDKNFKYRVFLPYIIVGGLLAWLIIAQP